MSLDYYIISQTTGDNDSSSQVLSQNTLAYNNNISYGNYFSYLYPTYRLEGASLLYYERDYNSITYEITNGKSYTIFFSGESTPSVIGHTGTTIITHSLYRLPFTANTLYLSNPDADGIIDIQPFFDNPLLSISEQVSAITISNSAYTYNFPTLYKDVGNFTRNVFEDKDQFFLDTLFSFEESNDLTLGDCYIYGGFDTASNREIYTRLFLEPSATTFYTSNLGTLEITGSSAYSGTSYRGAFFTYFVPPKKPNLNVSGGRQLINVQGTQTNLSPVFNFSNVDDGDYYQLQVNYDVNDTPFSGTNIYTYNINKQVGDAEFVRVYSTPLRINDDFLYRIGNVKEIVNVFDNRQAITTWSDSISASIKATGVFRLSGYTWRNYISNTFNGAYHISGMTIAGSTSEQTTFTFTTSNIIGMPANTISAATDGISTVTIDYNGTLYTQDWRNAIYSADNWSNLGLYIVGDSPNTGITDSSFSFSTVTQAMPSVDLTLYQVYSNSLVNLSIDLRSSLQVAPVDASEYAGSTIGLQLTRTSGPDGFFDFGTINGGYYRLLAIPASPTYAAYETIDIFITINSATILNLIFYILWGNNNPAITFETLSNETFL